MFNPIGVITNKKNYERMIKLVNNSDIEKNIIYLNNKDLSGLKNVKFKAIVIDDNTDYKDKDAKILLNNTKNFIVNSDIASNLQWVSGRKLNVVTYGFRTKATITASSISGDEMLVCFQRNIKDLKNNIIEPQEIKVKNKSINLEKNARNAMIMASIEKIYN